VKKGAEQVDISLNGQFIALLRLGFLIWLG